MPPALPRRLASVLAVILVASSCSGGAAVDGPVSLADVGRIPGVQASSGAIIVDGIRANLSILEGPTLATGAAGNRLLVIGDSILAGTASRYGGAMCSALVPLGWNVAVEAEAGQMVGFGREVLRKRIYEGWDAAVVFLGTNYGGSAERYSSDLTRIVESLAPRPTLLLTATLFKPTMQEVNREIRLVASRNPNVSILDWSTASAQPGLLNDDGIHPNNTGRSVLVASIAAAVGHAPKAGSGACLSSLFTDDSLVTDDDAVPSTTVDPTLAGGTATTVASATTVGPTPGFGATTTTTVG